jgi:uncharacterized damage-inducible protein DinB
MPALADYRYRGARALVLLHDHHLRAFLTTWRRAVAAGVALPSTDDPAYASLAALLRHVVGAAGGYLRWMTEQLGLPDPGIDPVPPADEIEAHADAYLEHVLERWREPLRDVAPEHFEGHAYASRWGDPFTIDGMLEHAVMHPIRHAFQLEELLVEGA